MEANTAGATSLGVACLLLGPGLKTLETERTLLAEGPSTVIYVY